MSADVNKSIVKEWVEEIWNKGKLDLLGRFHPPAFENHGEPTTIEETKKWHLKNRRTLQPPQG